MMGFRNNDFSGNPNNAGSNNPLNPIIDLKVILSKEEVSYLFGFDGVLISQLRAQTGANVGITDGDSHEYVLCIGGSIDIICKAFSLVCRKLWNFLTGLSGPNHQNPLRIRLAVPSSQCGSIIGKQGSKVKEIRDLTQANIQVSQESLKDSTERCVEISGSGEACLQATYHICTIMQDAPLRGELVPYIPPKRQQFYQTSADHWRPVFLCGDKAYVIDGRVARPAPPELLRQELAKTPLGGEVAETLARRSAEQNGAETDHMNPLALMAAISKAQRNGGSGQTSREMTVNSDLWIVMSNNGARIDEIQRMSGAQVHVSDLQHPDDQERLLTLTGSEESILLAQFLIQSNIDLAMKQRQSQTVLPAATLGSHAFDIAPQPPQFQQPQQQRPPPGPPARGGRRRSPGRAGGGRRGGRR